jgi:Hemolysin coregulated protein Hcp (TssD)
MSFSAIFKFDGGKPEGQEVVSCFQAFTQTTDDKGRPSSGVYGGGLVVQIVSTNDTKLSEYMLDPFQRFNGSVTFLRTDAEAVFKEIIFEDAYCVQYTDSLPNQNTSTMMVTLSARTISVNGVKFANNW